MFYLDNQKEQPRQLFEDAEELREIEESVEQQRAIPNTEPQLADLYIRPQAIRNSRFHHYLSKNIAISNLTEADIRTLILYQGCLNNHIYMFEMGWVDKEVPLEVASEMDTWLQGKKAIHGEFFKLLVERRLKLTKEEIQPQGRGKLLGRF